MNPSRMIENAKMMGYRRQDAEKNLAQANRHVRETMMEYRTMDKDINTVRPQLMKLQRNIDEYKRYLVRMAIILLVFVVHVIKYTYPILLTRLFTF